MTGRLRWAVLLGIIAARNSTGPIDAPRAVMRLWVWHVVKGRRGPARVSLPVGGDLEVPVRNQNAGLLVATGFTERGDQLLAASLAGPDCLLIDVGANIGVYSVAAAARGSRVVAYEPAPSTAATLAANLATWPGTLVRVVAVGDGPGRARLLGDGVGARIDDRGDHEVEVVSLDDESLPDAARTVLKVDAEGSDPRVLLGALSLIARRRPVVIVEAWSGGRDLRELLEPLAYVAMRTNRHGRLTEVAEDFAGQGNLVFVPREQLTDVLTRSLEPVALDRLRVRFGRD